MRLSIEYIAGLFDGEGHVSITETKKASGINPKLCVKLVNTHLPVLKMVKDLYGGNIYTTKKAKEHYLQCYCLGLTVEQSKVFLADIIPHLVIKRVQAEAALRFSATVYRRGKSIVTEEEKRIRSECIQIVRKSKMQEWLNE